MLHQLTLLIGRFDPNEPHGRPPNRLTDRGRVSGVVLVALDLSLDVLRWHQSHLVAEPRQFACPMVRRGTGFYADKARRQTFKKRDQLPAPKLLSNNHRLVAVDAVDLKHVLGDIQPDRGNLHVDGSHHVIRL